MKELLTGISVLLCVAAHAGQKQNARAENPLFDMHELLDASTLDVEVLAEWHVVKGPVPTRQKLVTIRVGQLWPGQDYRIQVRMIVPAERRAKGFHLTGGHQLKQLQRDVRLRGVQNDLIDGRVGLVQTIVQEPRQFGKAELAYAMRKRFIETLDPHYSIQYWAWPATLMRATTAAYSEEDHFEKGKVAMSGGSKNGASPSVAIIADKRLTALHATVSPIWESPLRLCDRTAWDELNRFNQRYAQNSKHPFLGGTFGPIYNADALNAGHNWADIQHLALRLADDIFISKNLDVLKARNVDLYFHPGTHDFVAYDIAWGGRHYPQIPIYLKANSGHGKAKGHPASEKDEQNKAAFLLQHFFPGVEPMLGPPTVDHKVKDNKLLVAVKFKPSSRSVSENPIVGPRASGFSTGKDGEAGDIGVYRRCSSRCTSGQSSRTTSRSKPDRILRQAPMAESGRIWWMYDRGPDGSAAYIRELFGDDQWKEMKYDTAKNAWTVEIDLEANASHIDFFSNHRKTIQYKSKDFPTYISSPYTRVRINQRIQREI